MSFQTGLSGLNASARNLDVIGNNIANANTTGMKSSRSEFSELVASSMGVGYGGNAAGIGVSVAAVAQQFTQGNVSTTGNNLDVAINGGGFFQLSKPSGTPGGTATQDYSYTRDGSFKVDKDGYLKSNSGANVLGYLPDASGKPITGVITALHLPTGAPIAAKSTTKITAEFNLDARAPVATSVQPPTPIATYGTSLNAYDSQGVAVPVNLSFVKTGPDLANGVLVDTWDVYDASALAAGTAALAANAPIAATNTTNFNLDTTNTALNLPNNALDASHTATNNLPANLANPLYVPLSTYSNGLLARLPTYSVTGISPAAAVIPPATALAATGALFQMQFDVDGTLTSPTTTTSLQITSPNTAIGQFTAQFDVLKATQYGTSFAVSDLTQNGYTSGEMTGVNIGADGMITARFSNGQTQTAGQLALADFRNVQGLEPIGNNAWAETFASGEPVRGGPGVGRFGGLQSGALEDSNVDLTAELVNMMTAQRAYQANAQTIKTQDQIMTTLVNLR